jgi:hypothetical protein
MNEAVALTRLRAMTAYDQAPTLSDEDLTALLDLAKLADSAGLAPSEADWVPTYDLNRAAAEGWRWKAAQLAGSHFDFSADGATYNRQQLYTNCLEMARRYSAKVVTAAYAVSQMAIDHPADDEDDLTN